MAVDAAAGIISEDGLRGLTIRGVAAKIGYTSGTLYQLFENLDALVFEVHVATLELLRAELAAIPLEGSAEDRLLSMARGYGDFAARNINRWNALFEHEWPDQRDPPQQYLAVVTDLIGFGAQALETLFDPADPVSATREARVIWPSLFGIVSLSTSGKLSRFLDTDEIIVSLVTNYVAGLRAKLAQDKENGG